MAIAGACLCGALTWDVEGPIERLVHCHCAICRKHHGAPFATHAVVPPERMHWRRQDVAIVAHASSPGRTRRACSACGAVAPTTVGDRAVVPAGNLVGDLGEVAQVHAFVGSKAPWHVVSDPHPKHEGAAPGWESLEVAPPSTATVEGETSGSCVCGAVTFAVRGAPARWYQCHCSRCRRGRSAAHGSNTFFPAEQVDWRSGREDVRSYRPPDAARFTLSFCTLCGGAAPSERDGMPVVLVPAGLLDGDLPSRPQAHIHVASKAPWWTIHDAMPQFAELPPS